MIVGVRAIFICTHEDAKRTRIHTQQMNEHDRVTCVHCCAQVTQERTRKVRSDRGKKHNRQETLLQVSCVAWCDANNILVDGSPGGCAFKSGAHKARGCNRPGRPDLFVLEPGGDGSHGLAVELKVGGNVVSEAQQTYLMRLKSKGWRVGVVRELAEFIKLVNLHLNSVCVE